MGGTDAPDASTITGLEQVEERLGYRFKQRSLIETALTHRSHTHERSGAPAPSYERLEFLGDALLGFLVADWLYRNDEQAPEGVLSRRRQWIVRTSTLADKARQLGLGDAIRLGRGEERTGGRAKASLLADLFEAVLGAVYLDGGVRAARAFVRRHLGQDLTRTRGTSATPDDYKTVLQEIVQARLQQRPTYRIVSTCGPPHALQFEAEVLIGERLVGRGSGSNRKQAEQVAARQALLFIDDEGV